MATWPRDIEPEGAGKPVLPPALRSAGQRGTVQTRATVAAGWRWTERYPPLKTGRVEDEALLAFMDEAWNRGTSFDVTHPLLPGSGKSPNGTGTGSVQVRGAGQSGTSIQTDGWPLSTADVVVAGDFVAIAGVPGVFKITADASSDGSGIATLEIIPTIPAGSEPADDAAVTTTGVVFTCVLTSVPNRVRSRTPDFYAGIELGFQETL